RAQGVGIDPDLNPRWHGRAGECGPSLWTCSTTRVLRIEPNDLGTEILPHLLCKQGDVAPLVRGVSAGITDDHEGHMPPQQLLETPDSEVPAIAKIQEPPRGAVEARPPFLEQHAVHAEDRDGNALQPPPERLRITARTLLVADAGIPPITEPRICQAEEKRERKRGGAADAGSKGGAGDRNPAAEREALDFGTLALFGGEHVKRIRIVREGQRLESGERSR